MKKTYLWMAAMASLLSFTACSEDASPLDNGQNPGEVTIDDGATIELALSNTGVGTRAARPMGSSAAANNVNQVKLVFYKDDGGTWKADDKIQAYKEGTKGTEVGDEWTDNVVIFDETITEGVPGNTNRIEESKKIRLVGLAANTKYRIVAYGYNNAFPYGTPAPDQSNLGLFSTGDNHGKSGYDLEEVFAGYKEQQTQASAKFSSAPVVTITRQVAGILAYFKIPTKVGNDLVKTVKVIANDKSKGFKFPNFLLAANQEFNGIDDESAQSGEDLMVFDMKQCAANWQENAESQTDEYYTTGGTDKDGYTVPESGAKGLATNYKKTGKLVLKKDAFFGARYILPYAGHVDSQTLTVVLCGGTSGTDVLKTLKVTTNQIPDNGTKYNYDIRCNNFYSIGKKMASGNTGGNPDPDPDPENPNPDPDKPVDLGATDQIRVEINDAWKVLHDMDVEE